MTTEMILILILVFAVSALLKGWAGFGTNLLALPLLLLLGYVKTEAVPIVMSVNVVLNIVILFENKKFRFSAFRDIWIMVLAGGIFTFIGNFYLQESSEEFIRILVGVVLILFVLNKIFHQTFVIKHKERYFILVGMLSGALNGLAGLGGLPALILLSNSGMKRDRFKATLVLYFLMMNIFVVISSYVNGYFTSFVLINIGYALPAAVALTLVGVYLSRRVSEKWFQRSMLVVLFALGVNLIVRAVQAL